MVLIDTNSIRSFQDVINLANLKGVKIKAISIGINDYTKDALAKIANQTDGIFYSK